jgi:adenylate cyclase
LAADVVGYTALMGTDEDGTLQRLTELRQEILEPLINEHHGRIVKLMGDGLLVEFGSVVDAVACALAWQKQVNRHESNGDVDIRLQFRIGVNLGDVIVQGSEIHGDGVNLAARLEGLAEPGGICLSEDAYRQARGKVEATFEDRGEQELKNVAEPVRVYRVVNENLGSLTAGPVSIPLPLTDKPSIAVLPFANLSGDPEQEYFADGIAEDIITGLSKNPDLLVISRNSTFSYKGKSLRARDISKDLGARYVLEGSVRKAGQRVRVTTQLIDAKSDSHLWAERYDRELDDIFAVQDDVVGSIVHALGATDGALEKSARQQSIQMPETNQSAYDCYLRAREHFHQYADTGFDEAEALFKQAIELDPSFARAYSALAWLHFVRFKHIRSAPFESIEQQVLDLGLRSVRLDPDDYRAHWVLGALYTHQAKHALGLSEYDRAIRINSNDANLLAFSVDILIYCGRVQEAMQGCHRALRLDPNPPDWFWWQLGLCHFHLGEYDNALEAFGHMIALDAPRRLLAATYAHLDRLEEAHYEARQYMKVFPDFSIREWARTEPYVDPKELQRYVDGMRKAGLPD